MNPSRERLRFWVTAALALWAALWIFVAAEAAPLAAGADLPALSLNDQHDKPVTVGLATHWVVFTAEKPVSDMVSAVLAAEPAGVAELGALLGLSASPAAP